jgi:hypothetical protein
MERAKLVGINHVALEVGDVEEALAEAPLAVPTFRRAGFARTPSVTTDRNAIRQADAVIETWSVRG